MWFTCLTDHKVNQHHFFTEVTSSAIRMARMLFLLFVIDTSINWLQSYEKLSKYANILPNLAQKCVEYLQKSFIFRTFAGELVFTTNLPLP